MNEQQLADLFSEQIDNMLLGQSSTGPDVDDLQSLLDIGHHMSQTQFQASATAQTAFQNQLANWFGLANGGSPMTILGLSKAWFISIIVTVVVIISGAGFIAVIATSIFIFDPISELPASPTSEPSAEPTTEPTAEATAEPTAEATDEPTAEPTSEPTTEPTIEPTVIPTPKTPTIIFVSNVFISRLCRGSYTTERTLVNYGDRPLTDAALAWEVIEGAEMVDTLDIISPDFETAFSEDSATTDTSLTKETDVSSISTADDTITTHRNFANFDTISIEQEVKLEVDVKVKDAWWEAPDGTKIKVKLSIENEIELSLEEEGDHDRGHGNEDDGYDEDNPGKSREDEKSGHSGDEASFDSYSQIITIIKHGGDWVTLTGAAHPYGDGTLLVGGHIVIINDCTGLPPTLPPGSDVEIVGRLLPDGTFVAVNIIIIDSGVINIDFDSGVPVGGSSGGSDSDGGGSSGGGRGDHDRGHGNDADGHDEDNPGKSHDDDD